jgi:D-alanine-D-alanine ligase
MAKYDKKRVAVLFGGRSGEHEVSLMSARSVLAALDPDKYEVIQVGVSHEGEWLIGEDVLDRMESGDLDSLMPASILPSPVRTNLYRLRTTSTHGDTLESISTIDVVFPVLHGTFGEDGTLQGLLEMQGTAYVGAGVLASALAMDKGLFHDVMTVHGIPVVETIVFSRREVEEDLETTLERAESLVRPAYPLFVKPANLGSSVGVSKCQSRSDLVEGLNDAIRFDRRVLVQRAVNAREIEVSVLGNEFPEASIPGEILPSREFYSYEAKYIDDRSELRIPAPLDPELAEQIRVLAIQAYRAIDCAGMARADFLLDKDSGDVFVSELNTIPGFTKISMYPKLWEASGLPYPALVDRLIELAVERKADRDRIEHRYTQVRK